jgi:hypothetical protein
VIPAAAGNGPVSVCDHPGVLPATISAMCAFWAAILLAAAILGGWPVIAVGCCAAMVVAGVVVSVVIFRRIDNPDANLLPPAED